ncbi:MAG: signal recognition particle-docking protein FtsY [Dissulfurimicrobium sp.]|uniref:signal recognition particle-docking protein FtsY n=1 Tax=Dissulfurimicrobium sp. TaxID=2022436 RepID=UPI0040493934
MIKKWLQKIKDWDKPSELDEPDHTGKNDTENVQEPSDIIKPKSKKTDIDKKIEDIQKETTTQSRPSTGLALFKRLKERMNKTREGFVRQMDQLILGKKEIDSELLDELEEVLVTADIGISTTQEIFNKIRNEVKRRELSDPNVLRDRIKGQILSLLQVDAPPINWRRTKPFVVLVVGVNGVGKTTTIAKLAYRLKQDGEKLKLLLAAGDTFRAAAIEQLEAWGKRAEIPVIKHQAGSDPSAVAYDAVEAGIKRGADVIIIDTAGRLHTKVNLMEELKKIKRVIAKKIPDAPHEILLVLDATTGQNAISQAKLFKETAGVTGIVLTKLDGTAKGGIVISIAHQMQIPIRFIGIGEGMEDLQPFDPKEFTEAIFSKN